MAHLQIGVPASLGSAASIGAAVRDFCVQEGVGSTETSMVELAMVEAVTNVVEHGYHDRPAGRVDVDVWIDADRIEADIQDDGAPVDPARVSPDTTQLDPPADRALLSEGGRGVMIIRGVFQEVTYSRADDRNRLTLKRRRGATAA